MIEDKENYSEDIPCSQSKWCVNATKIDNFNERLARCENVDIEDLHTLGCLHQRVLVKLSQTNNKTVAKLHSFDGNVIEVFKSIPGRQFDPRTKSWVFDVQHEQRLRNALSLLSYLVLV